MSTFQFRIINKGFNVSIMSGDYVSACDVLNSYIEENELD